MTSLTFRELANREVEAMGKITVLGEGDFCHVANGTYRGEAKAISKRWTLTR